MNVCKYSAGIENNVIEKYLFYYIISLSLLHNSNRKCRKCSWQMIVILDNNDT